MALLYNKIFNFLLKHVNQLVIIFIKNMYIIIMSCKGSWVFTAKNIVYNNNVLQCELRRRDGTFEKNEI